MTSEQSLEIKKLDLAIKVAETARMELELKIFERELDIKRMRDHIGLQNKRIDDCKAKIKELGG